jgi:hypothetical protein
MSAEPPARVAHRVFAHRSHWPGLYEHLTCDPRQHECRAGRGIGVSAPHRQFGEASEALCLRTWTDLEPVLRALLPASCEAKRTTRTDDRLGAISADDRIALPDRAVADDRVGDITVVRQVFRRERLTAISEPPIRRWSWTASSGDGG